MMGAFEKIPAVAAVAIGAIGDELTFSFPEVLNVIKLCSENEIAVLGLELFEARPEGYYGKKLSGYDQKINGGPLEIAGWPGYVKENNTLAQEFVRLYPTGDDHVYVLTTSSWREFCEIQRVKGSRPIR